MPPPAPVVPPTGQAVGGSVSLSESWDESAPAPAPPPRSPSPASDWDDSEPAPAPPPMAAATLYYPDSPAAEAEAPPSMPSQHSGAGSDTALSPRLARRRSTETSSGGARSSVASSERGSETMLEPARRSGSSGPSRSGPPTAGGSSSDESDDDEPPHSSQGSTRLPSSDSQPARRRESTYPDESLDTQGIRELIRDGADRREQTNLRILRSQQDPRDDDDDDDDDDRRVRAAGAAGAAPGAGADRDGVGLVLGAAAAGELRLLGRRPRRAAAAARPVDDDERRRDGHRRGHAALLRRRPPRPVHRLGDALLAGAARVPGLRDAAAVAVERRGRGAVPGGDADVPAAPERFEYTRPVNVARGQALPGEYTFDEEAESIDDDGDDDDLDPHPHRRLPPAAGSLNSLAAQSQAEDTPRPPRPRAADPGEPSLPWEPAKGPEGLLAGELARVAGRRAAGRAADGRRLVLRRVRRRGRVRHVRGDGGAAAGAGAGADGLELAPRVGLPVDGAARGPGHAEPAHGVLPAAAARGEAQVICTKVLYDSRERSNKTHRDFASLHMPLVVSAIYSLPHSNYPASPARLYEPALAES